MLFAEVDSDDFNGPSSSTVSDCSNINIARGLSLICIDLRVKYIAIAV